MSYVISNVLQHGAAVKEFQIRRQDGAAMPAWMPGSHIVLQFSSADGTAYENHYSLIGPPGETDVYRIAVQREEDGKGGSRYMHDEFAPGSPIQMTGPFNSFPLDIASPTRVLLIAGGIGITPMLSMAYALSEAGRPFELHYLARNPERLVLLDELRAIPGAVITLHVSQESGRTDLAALIGSYGQGDTFYACGPIALLQGLAEAGEQMDWPSAAMRFESFGPRAQTDDGPLVVELSLSEMTVHVLPGTSILDALIANDVFVSYDCKRGECGNCYALVEEGHPKHRDVCLTSVLREQGMCTCVSWATTGRLKLAL